MVDLLFYDDNSVDFGEEGPDFGHDDSRLESDDDLKSSVLSPSYSSDCLHPVMSCGIIDARSSFGYPNSSWLTKSESSESFDSRMDAMLNRVDPEHHGHAPDRTMTLEDIRAQFNSCYSCGVSWSDNHVSLDCSECGGYSLSRPCPMCDGKCKVQWRRDASMSHSMRKAHWEGQCRLPEEDVPSFLAEDVLIQGIEELSTSS